MATYAELLAQYNALWGWQKQQFLNQHPKFATRLRAGGDAAAPISCPPGYHAEKNFIGAWVCVPDAPAGETEQPVEETEEEEETEETAGGLEFIGLTPDGNQEIWRDPETGAITYKDTAQGIAAKATRENNLFTLYRDTLEQYGFSGTAVEDFLKQSVKEDWNASTFTIKMRQQDWYLANPLYAANLARSKAGGQFMAEAQVLAYADVARKLARDFGYQEPSDNYIALAIQGGMSPAEFEHRLTVQERIKQFGGGVAMVYEALMGTSATDQDLFEIFDPEISRKDFDDRARAAEMRGRPLLLGLGIRSAEEQRALEMLGVTNEQAWQGYQQLANALPSVSRLAAIDQSVKNDPTNPFDSFGSLFAAIFEGGERAVKAREALEALRTREIARHRERGTPVAAQGQLIGLLGAEERASYG